VGLDELGQLMRAGYTPEQRPWVAELVHGLVRDGLIAVQEHDGETRVRLP
jgi:hypothetical protein